MPQKEGLTNKMPLLNNQETNSNITSLHNFIYKELVAMTSNVITNYSINMSNRENNPFLLFEDTSIKKYMALGRSVDAQLGNRIQRIIFYISRLRYGLQNVPNIITLDICNEGTKSISCTLYSVPHDLDEREQNKNFDPYKQIILVGSNKTYKEIKKLLHVKATSNSIIKVDFTFNNIDEDTFKFIETMNNKRIPVDLIYFDCQNTELNNANTYEIKMGGNLDTKNAKSNAQEVKDLLTLFGFLQNNHSYFATCYGECSSSVVSNIEKIIGNDAILNNIDFWNKIIPTLENTFTYHEFIDVFKDAFKSSDLENKLKNL